jgi:hypothetical protein
MVTSKSDGGSNPLSDELKTGFDHDMFARMKSAESEIKQVTDSFGGVSGKLMLASFSHEKNTINTGRKNVSFFIF